MFRMRLVALVDELLDAHGARSAAAASRSTARPRRSTTTSRSARRREPLDPPADRARGAWRSGRGRSCMDEFLVSGETIVRNLELGWARAEALGGAMPVGYLPDMFGHIAQMPQILRRAGIEHAVVWRGVPTVIDRNTFDWAAPDGSAVETEYLVGGYGNGAYLFDVPDRLAPSWPATGPPTRRSTASVRCSPMYGTDHAVPSPRLADLVDAVNARNDGIEVRLETLADYAVRPEPDDRPFPSWTGELRSGARAPALKRRLVGYCG